MASAVSIDDFNTSLTLLLREIKSYIGNKFLEEIGAGGLDASIGTYLSEHISDIVNGTNINPIVKNFIDGAIDGTTIVINDDGTYSSTGTSGTLGKVTSVVEENGDDQVFSIELTGNTVAPSFTVETYGDDQVFYIEL